MFERFSKGARDVVVAAREEAKLLRHPLIGTEHLLLALVASPDPTGTLLRSEGLSVDGVRGLVLAHEPPAQPLIDDADAEALRSVGIDADAVLARIAATFGEEALLRPRELPKGRFGRRAAAGGMSPRARKVLELSLRETLRLGSREIQAAHLLLGLIREGQGLGAQVLTEAGIDLIELRGQVEAQLSRAA